MSQFNFAIADQVWERLSEALMDSLNAGCDYAHLAIEPKLFRAILWVEVHTARGKKVYKEHVWSLKALESIPEATLYNAICIPADRLVRELQLAAQKED